MPTKLKNLVITKVALVDEGSCSAAHIKLYKRKEGGNQIMGIEDILKLLPEDQREAARAAIEKAKTDAATAAADKKAADMEDMMDGGIDDALENPDGTPKADTKKKSVAKVANKVKELKGEIAKLKGASTSTEEELLKNVDPTVRALIEKSNAKAAAAEAVVKQMKDQADTQEAIAKVAELKNLSAKTEDLQNVFKSLKNLDANIYTQVFDVLKAADAMVASGNITGTTGVDGTGDDATFAKAADAAWTKIEQKADEIKKSANCTKEVAISKAISQNPDLYQEYLKNLK